MYFPLDVPDDAMDLINLLLLRNPAKRMGLSKDDSENIKKNTNYPHLLGHRYFKDINFTDLNNVTQYVNS